MTARRWLLGWVLFALACAQSLGFVHRVAHGAANWTAPEAHARDSAQPHAPSVSWTEALFAHDRSGLGCRLLDGAGQCGAVPHAAPLAQPLPPAVFALPFLIAALPPARTTPFQARAPPSSR